MNKIIIVVIILLLAALGFVFILNNKVPQKSEQTSIPPQSQSIDKQAAFAIFTNGTFRVFTAAMYHNLSQDVYIESDNPNIVEVKKESITWDDFFKTLPFSLSKDCLTTGTKQTFCTGQNGTLKFYLNGKQNDDALEQEIRDGDKLLVTFGNESDKEIETQLNQIPNP